LLRPFFVYEEKELTSKNQVSNPYMRLLKLWAQEVVKLIEAEHNEKDAAVNDKSSADPGKSAKV
jgi:hypothetical protein